jgi:succinyl-CoA synthetase beta subunit
VKVHEYQAKEILARFGVPVPRGRIATTASEALKVAGEIGGAGWVVKAQIHAGGRGKGGGVKVCRSLAELEEASSRMIGMQLVTPQTGPAGRRVEKVLITEAFGIEKEYYAGLVLDRKAALPVLMASAEGGVEIEETAARSPDKIARMLVDPQAGLHPYEGRLLARKLGFAGRHVGEAGALFVKLARAFLDTDASLAEINPLVIAEGGRLVALDAKFSFDDNALFRHPEIKEYRDLAEEEPQEVRASQHELSYIKMEGDIGCMVNGAGLAMATLDIIQHWGGKPANFLDVGGGATREKVTEAFKIILEDPNVRAVLVNIFGGIMKCDVIAEGIVAAAKVTALRVPLIVRLEGTNVAEGKAIMAASGLNVVLAGDLAEAAKKAVEAARRAGPGGRSATEERP